MKQVNMSNPKEARKLLKMMFVGPDEKPLFPVQMDDGRIVDGDTATDEDIMKIVFTLSTPNPSGMGQ